MFLGSISDVRAANVDTLFVYLKDNTLNVFPPGCVMGKEETSATLSLHVSGDTTFVYDKNNLASAGSVCPLSLASLASFVLDNKSNDQLFNNVKCGIANDSILAVVSSIGKWLTPTFIASDGAEVWVGNQLQVSGKNRIDFSQPVTYVVAWPGQLVYQAGRMSPYGRPYHIGFTFPADHSNNLPRIDINIDNQAMVDSKDIYLHAQIIFDGKGMYPSMTDSVYIKGRGNSSWSSNPWDKNPYRLKFNSKVKPFGLTKGKSWVLLANRIDNSMMTNAVGMKIANMVGAAGANHIIPVDLYMNGQYRGSYNFTEKVGFSGSSIAVADESHAVMLELDTYFDEIFKFQSDDYYLPVMIHGPDLSDGSSALTLDDIKSDFNAFARAVKTHSDSLSNYVDADALARYMFVNELILNNEIVHPKSTFLYKENVGSTDHRWIFGPVWDFDWAYGYEHHDDYATGDYNSNLWTASNFEAQQFWLDLRYGNPEIERAYYKVWYHFIHNNGLNELMDYIDNYFNFARVSFYNNYDKWNDGADYQVVVDHMKSWLRFRAFNIFNHLTPYDINDMPENPTGLMPVMVRGASSGKSLDMYNLQGICVRRNMTSAEYSTLHKGVYIIGGKKILIR